MRGIILVILILNVGAAMAAKIVKVPIERILAENKAAIFAISPPKFASALLC